MNCFYRVGMRDITANDAGAGSALLSTVQQATLGLGPAVFGSLLLVLMRNHHGSYTDAMVGFLGVEAVMMLLLAIIAIGLRHHLNRSPALSTS
ncbi:Uncharacterised protein [Kluyvera intermedia]|nr:Uncharacterised protein [Kluyvera intermedia]